MSRTKGRARPPGAPYAASAAGLTAPPYRESILRKIMSQWNYLTGGSWRKLSNCLILLTGLALLAYTGVRTTLLSFTHDESLTYLYHIFPGAFSLLDFSVANNHFLNSAFAALSCALFGSGEFALRLPNVIAHAAYLVATYLVMRRMRSIFLALCGFVILNMNPFMLDFFSLARGYGMALSCMMLSVHFYLRSIEQASRRTENVALAFWFAWAAALANLALLNYYVALVVVYILLDAFVLARSSSYPKESAQKLSVVLARHRFLLGHLVLLCVTILPIAWSCRLGGELYYGGKEGFWHDTVGSLIGASMYGLTYTSGITTLIYAVVACVVVISAVVLVRCVRKGALENGTLCLAAVFGLVSVAALCSIAQHFVLGTNYLIERTAIFFIPLFCLLLIQLVDHLFAAGNVGLRYVGTFALILGVASILYHNVKVMNFDSTLTWKYDANTKQMMSDLAVDHALDKGGPEKISLGVNWMFEPTVNYYRVTRGFVWLKEATRMGLDGEYDYYFYMPEDVPLMSGKMAAKILEYRSTHNILAKSARWNAPPTLSGSN